jgi:hypothetical protein
MFQGNQDLHVEIGKRQVGRIPPIATPSFRNTLDDRSELELAHREVNGRTTYPFDA